MHEPHERERTTVVTSSGGGAGWFIVGGLVVLAIVAVWLFGGGFIDGNQTSGVNVDIPENVEIEVDRAPAPEAEPEAAPEAEPAPSE